ncbi:MAG TPA: DUF192 domain-containing protein [Terracidiphilus sp.]|nr:DUF192 domain-containing protein [Terracidiphilus sp.]
MNEASSGPAKGVKSPDATRVRAVNQTRQTSLGDYIEVADRGPTRAKGLLGRKQLDPGGGMWIVPCESVHTFFMQFPIDLVYLDKGNRVRKVRHAVRPWRTSVCLSAHSIIELPAGTILRTKTEKGDLVEFIPSGA